MIPQIGKEEKKILRTSEGIVPKFLGQLGPIHPPLPQCSIQKLQGFCLGTAFRYLQCTPWSSSSSILYGKPNPLSPFHYMVYDVENDWFATFTDLKIHTTRNTVCFAVYTNYVQGFCLGTAFRYLQCTPWSSSSSILYGKPNPLSPFHYRFYDVENDWFATFTDLPGTSCLLNLQN